MRVVPELYCQSIRDNITFFVDVLGFAIKYQREEEEFVYLTREGVELILEGVGGNSRKWLTGDLEHPFERGVNFQWDVVISTRSIQQYSLKHPVRSFFPWKANLI